MGTLIRFSSILKLGLLFIAKHHLSWEISWSFWTAFVVVVVWCDELRNGQSGRRHGNPVWKDSAVENGRLCQRGWPICWLLFTRWRRSVDIVKVTFATVICETLRLSWKDALSVHWPFLFFKGNEKKIEVDSAEPETTVTKAYSVTSKARRRNRPAPEIAVASSRSSQADQWRASQNDRSSSRENG